MEESLLTAEQAAQELNVSLPAIRKWIFSGMLPVIHLGRSVRIKKTVLTRIKKEGLNSVTKESIE